MEQQDNSMEQQQDTAQPTAAEPRIDVGTVLREARENAGMSVEEVAGRLKFAPRQIAALEDGDFSQLPQMTFVRGFVRGYARLMELDEKALLDALPSARTQTTVETPSGARVVPRRGSEGSKQNLFWLGGVIVLVAVVIIAWKYDAGQAVPQGEQGSSSTEVTGHPASNVAAASAPAATGGETAGSAQMPQSGMPQSGQMGQPVSGVAAGRAQPTAPATPPPAPKAHPSGTGKAASEKPQPATATGTSAGKSALQAGSAAMLHAGPQALSKGGLSAPAGQAASHPVGASRSVHFQFEEDSWVEVRDGTDHVLLSMMGKKGGSRTVSGPPPLHVVVGNAKGVKLFYKGKPVELVPASGSNAVRLKLE